MAKPLGHAGNLIRTIDVMADESLNNSTDAPDDASAAPTVSVGARGWAEIWQLPALLLGVVLLGVGLMMILSTPEKKNDYSAALDEVSKAIHLQQFDEAEDKLLHIGSHLEQATSEEKARFELLSADLVANEIQVSPFDYDTPENHERVVAYYQNADKMGAVFDEPRLRRWVLTLVALGREDEAIAMLDRFGKDAAASRYEVLREMIDRRRARAPEDGTGLTLLLDRFKDELRRETNPKVRRPHEIWAAGIEAGMLLDAGDSLRGIDLLLRHMAQFRATGSDDDLAPLMVQLAKAYQNSNDLSQAENWYRQALKKLQPNPGSALNADVLVGLGQVTLAQGGEPRQALPYFDQAESGYPQTPAWFAALLGRAHCEASLGTHDQAMEHFALGVKTLTGQRPANETDHKALTAYVREHYQLNYDKQEFDRSLDYLSLLSPLYPKEVPVDLLADFALIHLKIAEQRMEKAKDIAPAMATDGPDAPESIDSRRLAFQQAAIHFGKAADYNYQYAQQVSAIDDDAYGASLWAAATLYDRAQLWKRAIEVYSQYVKTRSGDPRQLRAQHQLGLAYLADGQFDQAAELLAQLISEHPRSPEAYISLVPLARAYTRMNKPDDALRVLRHVVTDHPTITRESEEYRLALIDLGKLLYHQNDFVGAIPYLDEALTRYAQQPGGAGLRFRLADAYRQSVSQLDRQLTEPMNSSNRTARQQERRDRLTKGQVLFSQVVSELEARDITSLSPLERLFHRNAYFYRADCAYDLGQYEQAIALYDLAAKRWDKDPSSLVALVQIVNANCELNRLQAARVANMRARERLKQIPEEAFDDVTIPMTRRHWEDWLRWSSQLDLFGSQASG